MELRLLGAVEVWSGGRRVEVPAAKQRLLLVALGVDVGRPVPVESLLERLWDDPPPQARATLYAYLSRLKGLLPREPGGASPLVRHATGYALELPESAVDVARFQYLLDTASGPDADPRDRLDSLAEALRLWRGRPFDVADGQWARQVRAALERQQLAAIIQFAEAHLALRDPEPAIEILTTTSPEHPLHEPLAATLLHALHAGGRTAEALDVYTRVRRRLVDELGVEPGPQLRDAHRAVLRGSGDPVEAPAEPPSQPSELPAQPPPDPPARVRTGPSPRRVPAQLPADVPAFTGRRTELAHLDRLLAAAAEDDTAPAADTAIVISAVSGTAGVGKTALAVRWAHRVRTAFPDGQLYANLRGYDPDGPVAPADALAWFLSALGVAEEEIPLDVDQGAARFRTELANRRLLVVLDNASSADQVRALLPGSPSCVVVVTSRDSLAGLVALHGAHRIDLDLLPAADAVSLLGRLIGGRVDAEPDAAAVLAHQCARLPLALRIAAELAAARPGTSLAELVTELRDEQGRLHLLDAGGDPRTAVSAVFAWSLQRLPADAARVFALLGLHPGPDVDAHAAAALADVAVDDAHRILHQLSRAHLVRPVYEHAAASRYAMHDLLRAYAVQLATTGSEAGGADAALDRLFDHYLAAAADAMEWLYPGEAHRRPAVYGVTGRAFTDRDAARAWLDGERPTLVAVAAHTAEHGWPGHTSRLAAVLFRYLASGHHTDALTIHHHARNAARRTGDRAGEALALLGLGTVHTRLGRRAMAAGHFEQALALFRETGDDVGQARALNNLGSVHFRHGHYRVAGSHYEQALALYRRAGDRMGQAHALNNLGGIEVRLGRYGEARAHFEQALDLYRTAGVASGEAFALIAVGTAESHLGDHDRAVGHIRQALTMYLEMGNRSGEAWTLTLLGSVRDRLGELADAERLHARALALFQEIGERYGEAWTHNSLGEVARRAGRARHAADRHTLALGIASDTGARDQQARAHAGLGYAYRDFGEAATARAELERALAIYEDLGTPEANQLKQDLAP